MARKTEWVELGPDQYRGLGQRLFATSASEVGLLEAREIVLSNPEQPAQDPSPAAGDACPQLHRAHGHRRRRCATACSRPCWTG